ncbi:MAG TPA: ABC transporter ATP-binding protein [bacterium]|nr:ABC transporter ATP-binding protein [bacterium]
MNPPAIQIENLHKRYGNLAALQGVDLEIPAGQFFGLLGPNGAGKTTLISAIVGLVKPNEGMARVFGHSVSAEPRAAKRFIGFSPQEINTDRFFNLRRTLEFQGGFHGLARGEARELADKLLHQFGLAEKAKLQFYKLSGGMQKRLMIARALMSQPRLLILDEPTAGVDVEQRHELWKYLRDLNKNGTTILLTTHYIDEAQALCERIGIIDHGRIIELGTPGDLIAKYCDSEVEILVQGPVDAEEFADLPEVSVGQGKIRARTKRLGQTVEFLLQRLLAKPGRKVEDINLKKGDLEEVFLKLTGKTIGEVEKAGERAKGAAA